MTSNSSKWLLKKLAESLCMPKVAFPIRQDTKAVENSFRDKLSTGLYKWQTENRTDRPIFRLHDGPPFANGPLHIGIIVYAITLLGRSCIEQDIEGYCFEIQADERLSNSS